MAAVAPFARATAANDVERDPRATPKQHHALAVTNEAADACAPTQTLAVSFRANAEERLAASATDDVEGTGTVWTVAGAAGDLVWSRVQVAPDNHVWRGVDLSHLSDSWLESPPLRVSATGRLGLSFRHRHEFERGDNPTVYYDGAVIELQRTDGGSWDDIATYAAPPYYGVLEAGSGNALGNRAAFVDHNPSWPAMDTVTLDLGTALAGDTVRVRFRLATDEAAGAAGWDLDDLAFSGVDDTPFSTWVARPGACAAPVDAGPPPDAGVDRTASVSAGGCQAAPASPGALALLLLAGLARRRR
jgi:MYXO-CTERM domain-containing protein